MNVAGLHTLRQILATRSSVHLDDETLASMATAEASGETIEPMYTTELEHIEVCVRCAEQYQALVMMLSEALGEMAAAADLIPPDQVFAALLADRLRTTTGETGDYQPITQQVAEALPFVFTTSPTQPDEVTTELIGAAASGAPPTLVTALTQAIQDNLATLHLYLNRVADSFWGQMVNLKAEMADSWRTVELTPMARPQTALLHGTETGQTWQLFSQSIGSVPLTVTAWAIRLSPLACELTIRADRPGLRRPAGRTIHITYPGHTYTLQTGVNGEVRLAPFPVAALPHLKVQVGPDIPN